LLSSYVARPIFAVLHIYIICTHYIQKQERSYSAYLFLTHLVYRITYFQRYAIFITLWCKFQLPMLWRHRVYSAIAKGLLR